ncbi:MAG: CpaD family pilus assembly lipoprotein [Pacificimonas sp.]
MTRTSEMARFGLPLLALTLATACTAPGGEPPNTGVQSVNVPVVEREVMTYELVAPSANGFADAQRRELDEWLDSIGVAYGDRVSVDQAPVAGAATRRAQVETLMRQRGLMLAETGPVTAPAIAAGATRVVVVRSTASVPDCPNHDSADDVNYTNATSTSFGCGINSAIAQMVADPNDLIRGKTYGGPSADRAVQAVGKLPVK